MLAIIISDLFEYASGRHWCMACPWKKCTHFFLTRQANTKQNGLTHGRCVAYRRFNRCTQVQTTMIMTLTTIKLIYSVVTFCCAWLLSDDKFANAQSGSHELIERKWSISEHDKKGDYFHSMYMWQRPPPGFCDFRFHWFCQHVFQLSSPWWTPTNILSRSM